MKLSTKWRNPIQLFFVLILISVLLQLIENSFYDSLDMKYRIGSLFIYELVALIYGVKFVKEILIEIRNNKQPIYFAGIVVFLLAFFFPLFEFGINEKYFANLFVNLVFTVMVVTYLLHYIAQVKSENEIYEFESMFSTLNLADRYLLTSDPFTGFNLTEREIEIAKMIAEGYNYVEIAKRTFISAGTVRKHASTIFNKVGVSNLKEFSKQFSSSKTT